MSQVRISSHYRWRRLLPPDFPWVSALLGGLTVLVYLGQVLSEMIFGVDFLALWGVKFSPWIIQQHQYWRLLTPMFLHAGLIHIGLNMWGLYVLGPTLEQLLGPWRFALLYFVSAYAGNALSTLLSSGASLGASTAIFGLLGAYFVIFYVNRDYLGAYARHAANQALFWIVVNLVWSLQGRIDLWGHVGGLLGGALFSLMGGPVWADFGGKVYDYGARLLALRDHRPYRDVVLAALVTVGVFSGLLIWRYPQILPF